MAPIPFVIIVTIIFSAGTMAADSVVATKEYPARCTSSYCEDIEEDICRALPPNCTASQSDFFGWEALSPDPCNCCPYCFAYLGVDDICPIGQATGIVPTHICGPGLYCIMNTETAESRCKTMVDVVKNLPADTPQFNMDCTKEQVAYDQAVESGTLGNLQLRPACDRNGFYAPYKCIPGEICYCQDEYGNRIFGEIPFTPLASKTMHCGCSRHNAKISRQLNDFDNTWSQMRCMPDGSFDPIQCLDDACLCVDTTDGVPTYPDNDLVNITALDADTMPCFDNKSHTEYDYYRVCEDTFNRNYNDDLKFRLDGYETYGATYVKCQMDGNFALIQSNDKEVFCADPNGVKIEEYSVPIDDAAISEMDCKCARANLLISGLERPECSPNGNYKRMQCRRGECRCVDENGNQIEKEVPKEIAESLSCWEVDNTPSAVIIS